MAIHEALYSSRSEEWPTPPVFFARLHAEFNFTLDPCATPENAKTPLYFTKEQDGLAQHWGTHTVFCNPPYGKEIIKWVQKCWLASLGGGNCCSPRPFANRYKMVP